MITLLIIIMLAIHKLLYNNIIINSRARRPGVPTTSMSKNISNTTMSNSHNNIKTYKYMLCVYDCVVPPDAHWLSGCIGNDTTRPDVHWLSGYIGNEFYIY